jgi:hypothetical protein
MHDASEPRRRCRTCRYEVIGAEAIGVFFERQGRQHRDGGVIQHPPVRIALDCAGCLQTEGDAKKQTLEGRMRQKARDSLRRHAKKFGLAPGVFARRFGWDVARMTHDMLHVYENTCPYCWTEFAAMSGGPSNLTVDIIDPRRAPHYATQVKYCCWTCNQQKATMEPHLWAIKCDEFRRRRRFLDEQPLDQPQQLVLGLGASG